MVRILLIVNFFWFSLPIFCATFSASAEVPSSRESVRLESLQRKEGDLYQDQASIFEKSFQKALPYSKTDSSASVIPTLAYRKPAFFGVKNYFLRKKAAVEKTSYGVSTVAGEIEGKAFLTRSYVTRVSSLAGKRCSLTSQQFPVKMIALDPKAQGGLDQDQKLQQSLKKTRGLREVRALLDSEI